MLSIFNLIRWKNLVMIALVQLLIKYAFFPAFNIKDTFSDFNFFLLVMATLFIAAGGYVINDIYDLKADRINKPDKVYINKVITESNANMLYIIMTFSGACIGFYLSSLIDKNSYFGIFILTAALLYVYSSYLKGIILVGNIVVSIVVALSIIIVGIFELLPAITAQNQNDQLIMFKIIFDYAVFAFFINLIREIVKDIQDVDGDYKTGIKTLPIAIGKDRAAKFAIVITIILALTIVYYLYAFVFMHKEAVIYFLIAVIAPLILVAIKLFSIEKEKDLKMTSRLLKITMLTGMLSMLLYYFIL